MRILFISTTFPDAQAPSRGTYNSALVRALQREHSVSVISPRFFTEAFSWRSGCRQFTIPEEFRRKAIPVQYPTAWYTPRCLQQHYGSQMWWSIRQTVAAELKCFQPDVVLSYWAHPDGEVGLRAARQAGIPCAVIVGGSDVLLLPNLPHRGKRVLDVLQQSSAVITVSEGLRDATRKLGVTEDKIHTIYQGVEEHLFDRTRSRQAARNRLQLTDDFAHLLWVGRMVGVKALPDLLEACRHLRGAGVRFRLHLLGNGPLQQPMQQLTSQLGLDSSVCFHGAVGHDQIPDWYRAADLTVLSSHSEGLPNVLRESLACGTPFVATDVGSIREIAVSEASCLATPCNPLAFAQAVQEMLRPEARLAATAYLPRTWNDTARETGQLLERLRQSDAVPARSLTSGSQSMRKSLPQELLTP